MSPTTLKYVHALEFAALGAAIPVINGWVQSEPTDWHTALKALIGAVLTGVWTFVRSSPPPVAVTDLFKQNPPPPTI
jgi:hypothetical protein